MFSQFKQETLHMTTNTLSGIHVDALANSGNALTSLRTSYEAKHRHIIDEAKAKVLKLSRNEMCEDFNVECIEGNDDEGGGSIALKFPPDWSEEQAECFASRFLDLDLNTVYRGAGQYFQNSGIGRHVDTGEIFISVSWGLDI